MAPHYDKHVWINYIKTETLEKNVLRVNMNRRLTNCGDECYWNKTLKTNSAVRLEVNHHDSHG